MPATSNSPRCTNCTEPTVTYWWDKDPDERIPLCPEYHALLHAQPELKALLLNFSADSLPH